jgi:hypothetical protein
MRTASIVSIVAIALLGTGLTACWVEPAPSHRTGTDPAPPPTSAPTTPPAPAPPPKIGIDNGKTLASAPGDGAGVFVAYFGGGHWSIQWTCDTNVTSRSCPFDISVGAADLVGPKVSPTTANLVVDATGFRVHTETTNSLDSATFDLKPGASIVLSVAIRGAAMPSLVFYVSDGRLSTAPTDPIELVPNVP